MKKILLSAFVVFTFTAYALHQRLEGAEDVLPVFPLRLSETKQQTFSGLTTPVYTPTPTTTPTTTPHSVSEATTNVPTRQITSTPTRTPARTGFKDGTYKGAVADAYYGNVQVQITISGGKITDVQFLDYPQDRRTSISINTQAMPYLKSEAIQAQSAKVNTVSGATQTSRAFRESLQSALNKAI